MEINSFGEYLRFLRVSRKPAMTQEELGRAVGRGKMTISQFENGKNSPPQGELLESIISALSLTSDEASKLIFLSAKFRKGIPVDIEEYFFSNPAIYAAIRADMKIDISAFFVFTKQENKAWKQMLLEIEDEE